MVHHDPILGSPKKQTLPLAGRVCFFAFDFSVTHLGNLVQVRSVAAIFSPTRIFSKQSSSNEIIQRSFDSRTGKPKFQCNGLNGRPAAAFTVCPVLEIHIDALGPMAQIRSIDTAKSIHVPISPPSGAQYCFTGIFLSLHTMIHTADGRRHILRRLLLSHSSIVAADDGFFQLLLICISEHRIHYLKDISDRAVLIEYGQITRELDASAFRSLSNEEANRMGLRSTDLLSIRPPVTQKKTGAEEQICLENLSYRYTRESETLANVNLSAGKGDIVGIVGTNGVGKSTLLEIVCGLKKETNGEVRFGGQAVNSKTRVRDTFLVMQSSDYQLFTESVEKELFLGNDGNEELRKKGRILLERMGLLDYRQQHPASMSGGQKQRLCIAVACMKDTDVICFDEPTSGLDYSSMVNVSSLLHELAEQGKTLLVTTHDYEFLMHTCTHICYLLNGRVESFFPVEPRYTPQIYSILFQKEVVL